MVESGRPISELAHQFEPVPQLLENVSFTGGAPLQNPGVIAAMADAEARLEGIGHLLFHPSGTEKLIRVMAEGDDKALVKAVVANVVEAVKGDLTTRNLHVSAETDFGSAPETWRPSPPPLRAALLRTQSRYSG